MDCIQKIWFQKLWRELSLNQTTCNQLVNVLEVKHGPEPEVPVTSIICTRCVFDLSMIFDLALANMRCPVFMCMWMLLAKATALRT